MFRQKAGWSTRGVRNWLTGLTTPRVFFLIFALAFIVRILGVFASRQYLNQDRYELERTAISLAQTGVYGNPYAIPTGPSAHVSPGYTLILAAIFNLCGTGIPGELVKQILASAVTALQAALIFPVGRALGLDRHASLFTAIFCSLLPLKFSTETMGDWETPYTAIALMTLSVLMARDYRSSLFSIRHALLAGFVWGVSILFASLLLVTFSAFLLMNFVVSWRKDYLGCLRFCLIEGLTVAVCLAPWAIRNDRELGAPIATRTNLGLELLVSNNDIATADEHLNLLRGVYRTYHPFQNPREALKLRRLGEVEYNRQAQEQALTWIRQHRKQFIHLTLQRARLFWFYENPLMPLLQRVKYRGLEVIHLLGFLALFYLFRSNPMAAFVLSTILAVYPILNYFIHVGPRQSYPVDWILDLLMFTALVRLVTMRFDRYALGVLRWLQKLILMHGSPDAWGGMFVNFLAHF